MDIVDAQVHLERHMELGGILAAMDALGIQAVMIDEFRGMNEQGEGEPRAIDAYCIERGMWASDFTLGQSGSTWAALLHYNCNSAARSQGDKEWLLGRTARKLFRWEAPNKLEKEVRP